MDDVDIRRSAWIMMAEHGAGAEIAGAMWADKIYLDKDRSAFRVWVRITAAIIDLERTALAAANLLTNAFGSARASNDVLRDSTSI
jgi:hypothetical protein